ncbi:MAG: AraC family transcriptional regulator [Xanthomonadales bacterium]|nr:AraC family transcriptional regulator [Xanthomonadales bacterium]
MTDRLSAILDRFELRARVFHSGHLCGAVDFDGADHSGHLHILRSGTLHIDQPGSAAIELDQPTLLFYAGSTPHQLRTDPGESVDLLCATVDFGTGALNPLLASLPTLLQIPLSHSSMLSKTLELLFDEAFAQHCGRQLALNRLTELLMLQLFRHVMEQRLVESGSLAGLADPRLAKALVAMHAQPQAPWSLERLAGEAGMSRARFAAHFHQTVGMTPGEYLGSWRLAVAKSLLRQGKSVKLVAFDVGYATASALARAFHERFGLSPTAWLASDQPASS